MNFIEAAQRMIVPPELEWPWTLFLRAVDAGWIDCDELSDMIDALKKDNFGGYSVEEFYIEPRWGIDGEVKVGFLNEYDFCAQIFLVELFEALYGIYTKTS
jgi:hypothetical protein